MLKCMYVRGPKLDFKAEVETLDEALEWVRGIEKERKFSVSVLDEEFRIDKDNFKQWGTSYFWFSVETK